MKASAFRKLLVSLGACDEAMRWSKGKDFSSVWATCTRADWLLWLCGKMADKPQWPTRKHVVLAACACAETALKFVKPGEDRPRLAIETARKWCAGEATIEQVRQARAAAAAAYAAAYADAAYADAYAAAAAYAAAYADAAYADAYADAAYADAYAAAAAYAAYAAAYADAAYADAYAAAYAAAYARTAALSQMADLVRSLIPMPTLEREP